MSNKLPARFNQHSISGRTFLPRDIGANQSGDLATIRAGIMAEVDEFIGENYWLMHLINGTDLQRFMLGKVCQNSLLYEGMKTVVVSTQIISNRSIVTDELI